MIRRLLEFFRPDAAARAGRRVEEAAAALQAAVTERADVAAELHQAEQDFDREGTDDAADKVHRTRLRAERAARREEAASRELRDATTAGELARLEHDLDAAIRREAEARITYNAAAVAAETMIAAALEAGEAAEHALEALGSARHELAGEAGAVEQARAALAAGFPSEAAAFDDAHRDAMKDERAHRARFDVTLDRMALPSRVAAKLRAVAGLVAEHVQAIAAEQREHAAVAGLPTVPDAFGLVVLERAGYETRSRKQQAAEHGVDPHFGTVADDSRIKRWAVLLEGGAWSIYAAPAILRKLRHVDMDEAVEALLMHPAAEARAELERLEATRNEAERPAREAAERKRLAALRAGRNRSNGVELDEVRRMPRPRDLDASRAPRRAPQAGVPDEFSSKAPWQAQPHPEAAPIRNAP